MLRSIALLGLLAALVFPPAAALALSGASSAYGTEGSGPRTPTRSGRILPATGTPDTKARSAREPGRLGCGVRAGAFPSDLAVAVWLSRDAGADPGKGIFWVDSPISHPNGRRGTGVFEGRSP
jgi:hypothetical protein